MVELRHLFYFLVEEDWTIGEKIVRFKHFRRQTQECMAVFCVCCCWCCCFQTGWEMLSKSNKKETYHILQFHNIKVSRTTIWRVMTNYLQQKAESREEKKAANTSDMVSEDFANFIPCKGRPAGKLTWYECHRDETTYKDPAPPFPSPKKQKQQYWTNWDSYLRFTWKTKMWNKTLWKLLYSVPHRLENVRKHKGGHSA